MNMKKTLLSFVLFLFVSWVCLGQLGSLTREQAIAIPSQVLTNQVVVIDGREIQLDLFLFHENLTTSPEIRLVAHDLGKEYILWSADTGGVLPSELQFAIGGKNDIAGLCFEFGYNLIFYEIHLKTTLQSAKQEHYRVAPSAWWRGDPLLNTNDHRQEFMLRDLLKTTDAGVFIKNIELRSVSNKWVFSVVVKGIRAIQQKL